jgi:hypothetical protein
MVFLILGLSSNGVRADGGILRVNQAQGPFVVSILTGSELRQDRPEDVSVMIQGRYSGEVILDANVNLTFTPPATSIAEPHEEICGVSGKAAPEPHSEQFTVAATRRQASNKFLYAAPVEFGTTGPWHLQAFIERGGDAVKIGCSLPVGSPTRNFIGLFPYLILPPLVVALFTLNQCLREQSLKKRRWQEPV